MPEKPFQLKVGAKLKAGDKILTIGEEKEPKPQFDDKELRYIRYLIKRNVAKHGLWGYDMIISDKIKVLLGEMTQEEVDMKNEY